MTGATFAATGAGLTPRQAYAEVRGLVDPAFFHQTCLRRCV